MSEIQQNRYDQLLRRVADLKGPGSKVAWAVGDLLPVFDVENTPAELLALMGSRLCIGSTFVDAGAANYSTHQLWNPAGSGVIITLMQVAWVMEATSATIRFRITDSGLGTTGSNRGFVDSRLFDEGTVGETRNADSNSQITPQFGIEANLDFLWAPPKGIAVLSPGYGFTGQSGTVDLAARASWLWVERVAQPSELRL